MVTWLHGQLVTVKSFSRKIYVQSCGFMLFYVKIHVNFVAFLLSYGEVHVNVYVTDSGGRQRWWRMTDYGGGR